MRQIIRLAVLAVCLAQVIHCDKDFERQILDKFNTLNNRISSLETALLEKEKENAALKRQLDNHKRQLSYSPEQEVAFSARVSQHVTNLNAHQPIIFGNTLTNIGSYYNNVTGVFFVPVTGTYQFFVNILSEADNNIETELMVSGDVLAEIYSGAGKFHGAGSNFVIARLNRGANVWVKVHAAFSTDMAVHCCWSTFSGYLLREHQEDATVVVG